MKRTYFSENYRPKFHFTSQSNIINDPNGLVWYEDEYHLFHQFNINNHIHWGHAVSKDLVHWKHLAPALFPDDIGQIWSGSIVVDHSNSAGFQIGKESVLIAIFTYNEHIDAEQSQGLAYSRDRGRTWTMYDRNPILTGNGQKDFRDPKVFWDADRKRWSMVLACGDHAEFFASLDLIHWEKTGAFGSGIWEGTWECPDLFCMPINGKAGQSAWVLTISMNNGAPAGGTGMRYFTGRFDGKTFIPYEDHALWMDWGKDFYAGVTWNNIPEIDGRRLMIAWADNWRYRDYLPTTPFLGQFTCVRELSLVTEGGHYYLIQQPNQEVSSLRKRSWTYKDLRIDSSFILDEIIGGAFDIEMSVSGSKDSSFFMKIKSGQKFALLGIDFHKKELFFDRRNSSELRLPDYNECYTAKVNSESPVNLRILLDQSQIEVFSDNGKVVMTDLLFPDENTYSFELVMKSGIGWVEYMNIYSLDNIWKEEAIYYNNKCFDPITGQWAHTRQGIEGWSKNEGIALIPDADCQKWSCMVKITGYGNKRKAGLVLDLERKLYIYLDGIKKKFVLICDGNILLEKDTHVNKNRVYKIGIAQDRKLIKIFLDGVFQFEYPLWINTTAKAGLYVDNTFAHFMW